jgi:hypothetical protein
MSGDDESDCPFCNKPSADGHSHTYIEMNSEEFKGYVEAATERDQLRAALRELVEACSPISNKVRFNAARDGALALLEAKAGGR